MILVFDTETTGKADFNAEPEAPHQPRLVQLGAILYDKNFVVRSELNMIVRPDGFQIPEEATSIHGITHADALQYGFPELDVMIAFNYLCRRSHVLVAHNLKFDAFIIGKALFMCGLEAPPPEQKFCTMQAMTERCKLPGAYGGFKWPSLQEAYKHCFGEEFEGAHDAMADVRACARVYKWLQNPDLAKEQPKVKPVLGVEELTDDSPMPFGKWKGQKMRSVPASYFYWLWTDGCSNPLVKRYIETRLNALKKELPGKDW